MNKLDLKKHFDEYIDELINKLELLKNKNFLDNLSEAMFKINSCIETGGKVIFCGNGGSASDSQHLAAEFIGRYKFNRRAIPAIALNTDTSVLTSIANDFGYEKVFERQIEALGNSNDLLIAISTSGKSKNILNAVVAAKKMNIYTIGLTKDGGTSLSKLADLSISVPSQKVNHIQEMHILIGHFVCEIVEKNYIKSI